MYYNGLLRLVDTIPHSTIGLPTGACHGNNEFQYHRKYYKSIGGGRHLRWGDERHNHACLPGNFSIKCSEIASENTFEQKLATTGTLTKTSSEHCIVYIPAGFEAWGGN